MRRAIAVIVFLNLVSLTSGITLFRGAPSCCCSMKGGHACPMRARCSCSVSPHDAAYVRPMPRVVAESAYRIERIESARAFAPLAILQHDAADTPPDVPPPRAA